MFAGIVNSGAQSFNVKDLNSGFAPIRLFTPFRYQNHSLYVSDRWSAARGLTVSLGVRYEVFPAMTTATAGTRKPPLADVTTTIPSSLPPSASYSPISGTGGRKRP